MASSPPRPDGTREGLLSVQYEAERLVRHRLDTAKRDTDIAQRWVTLTPPLRDYTKKLAESVADFLGVAMIAWTTTEHPDPIVITLWGPDPVIDHVITLTDLYKQQGMEAADKLPQPRGIRRRGYVHAFNSAVAARLDVLRIVVAQSYRRDELKAVLTSHLAGYAAVNDAYPDTLVNDPVSGYDELSHLRDTELAILLGQANNRMVRRQRHLDTLTTPPPEGTDT